MHAGSPFLAWTAGILGTAVLLGLGIVALFVWWLRHPVDDAPGNGPDRSQ